MKKILLILFVAIVGSSIAQEISLNSVNGTIAFVFEKDGTEGTFSDVNTTISFDPANLSESKIAGSVAVSTINTGNKTRDQHLMADDMFGAEEFPEMTFAATSIEKTDSGYKALGALTIKGTTKDEAFDFSMESDAMVFKTAVNAADYGVVKAKNGQTSKVTVTVTIPFTKE